MKENERNENVKLRSEGKMTLYTAKYLKRDHQETLGKHYEKANKSQKNL